MVASTISEPRSLKVMFISRGHGWGHAIPDMAIAERLVDLEPDLDLQFVSYAAGAEAYRACGFDVVDLHAPDRPHLWDMVMTLTKFLANTQPDLVVAHEEVAALPAAAAFGIRSVYITDFFLDPSHMLTQALRYTDEIVFLAHKGLYTEPPYLQGKIHYVGRAVRGFEYMRADRARARQELGIPHDATVLLCQPGAWTESQVPLRGLLGAAWDILPQSPKRLIWLAGREYDALATFFRERPDVMVLKEDLRIDRLMAASDVLITKANRVTVYEAAAMGLPSISISHIENWPDDVAVIDVESNTYLSSDTITPESLSAIITEQASVKPTPATELSGGIAGAAARIAWNIGEVRARKMMTESIVA